MDRLEQFKQAKEIVNSTWPANMYGVDAQREFMIAYLMGMGWAFDDACDAVFDANTLRVH
jgi:hypothetical protein